MKNFLFLVNGEVGCVFVYYCIDLLVEKDFFFSLVLGNRFLFVIRLVVIIEGGVIDLGEFFE